MCLKNKRAEINLCSFSYEKIKGKSTAKDEP